MTPVGAAPVAAGRLPGRWSPRTSPVRGRRRRFAPAATPWFVLENTRFEPGETSNDPALATRLAALADVFVLDAFGSAHRAHSSTVGVAERLPSAAGTLLLAEEVGL